MPTYPADTKKHITVHIAEQPWASWLALDGHGIIASRLEIVSGFGDKPHMSKLIVEIPMSAVEIIP